MMDELPKLTADTVEGTFGWLPFGVGINSPAVPAMEATLVQSVITTSRSAEAPATLEHPSAVVRFWISAPRAV